MKNLFVPYELAEMAKDHGFDEPCLGYYSNWGTQDPFLLTCELGKEKDDCLNRRKNYLVSAPTYGQLADWFRRVKNLEVTIHTESSVNEIIGFYFTLYAPMSWPVLRISLPGQDLDYYLTYHEALVNAFSMIKPSKLKKT